MDTHSERQLQKTSGLRIRLEEALRQDFLLACREKDKTAAEVLRAFMKSYVSRMRAARREANQADDLPELEKK
jgi:hypothetical protein